MKIKIDVIGRRIQVVIFALVAVLMGAVYTIIILFSRKIRRPVNKLMTYTHMMNQAQNREDKINVVRKVESDEAFSEIAREFKAAKFIRKNSVSGVLLMPEN